MNRDAKGRFCKANNNKNISSKYRDNKYRDNKVHCCCHSKKKGKSSSLDGTYLPTFEEMWKSFREEYPEDNPTAADKKECEAVYEEIIKDLLKTCPGMFDKPETTKPEKKSEKEAMLDGIEGLLDSVSKSMIGKKSPETLEELLPFFDRNIEELKALKVAAEALLQLVKEHEQSSEAPSKKKRSKKKVKDEIPEEILEFIKESGVPMESIKACGCIDLNTGESWKKTF